MKLSKQLDLARANCSAEHLAELSAITWLEKWLKSHGLTAVMQENVTGFSTWTGSDMKYLDDLDWNGGKLRLESFVQQYFADLYVPAECKVLVQKALMESSTEHGLDWTKSTSLSYHKPANSTDNVPFVFETWKTQTPSDTAWRLNEVEIHFYWVPEIGEQVGNCTIGIEESHTAAKTEQNVVQICHRDSDE